MRENTVDYVLTEEEIENLPEPIRAQREAHLEFIRDMETQHPIEDGGSSVNDLAHAIMMRAVMDAATRSILTNGGQDGEENQGDD